MPVVLLVVIIVIFIGVFFVAIGRGGELAYEPADHAPLDLGPVTATDVALLHPPTALWGYNMQVTDEALTVIARAMRERDVRIAFLQRQLADLAHSGPDPVGRHQAARNEDPSDEPVTPPPAALADDTGMPGDAALPGDAVPAGVAVPAGDSPATTDEASGPPPSPTHSSAAAGDETFAAAEEQSW